EAGGPRGEPSAGRLLDFVRWGYADPGRNLARHAAVEDRQVGVYVEQDLFARLTGDAVDLLAVDEKTWRCERARVWDGHALGPERPCRGTRVEVSRPRERGEGEGRRSAAPVSGQCEYTRGGKGGEPGHDPD